MKSTRNLLAFLLLNVILSALATWVVLLIWEKNHPSPSLKPLDDFSIPTATIGLPFNLTPIATQAALSADQIAIKIDAVYGAGVLEKESIAITNAGEGSVNLIGWKVSNERGDSFMFPNLSLNPSGTVHVYTMQGVNTVIELFWGNANAIWHSGDLVTLTNAEGIVLATYTIP